MLSEINVAFLLNSVLYAFSMIDIDRVIQSGQHYESGSEFDYQCNSSADSPSQ